MEEEIKTTLCSMPWCRVRFSYKSEEIPKECPKCLSFSQDLSAGVDWKEYKYYGPRDDGRAHPIDIRVQRSGERRIW